MDGTLINVCYSMKHFVPQDKDKGDEFLLAPMGRNAERNVRGEKCSNETHTSTADPDARL